MKEVLCHRVVWSARKRWRAQWAYIGLDREAGSLSLDPDRPQVLGRLVTDGAGEAPVVLWIVREALHDEEVADAD